MTLVPRTLRMERFKSFLGRQEFPFPREPGLYLVVGKNEVEPRLGGNGSGKTAVWDALTWLLYERTPDGLRAGDVCHWDADGGTEVALEFSDGDDGLPAFCTRTWRPNSWKYQDLFGATVDLAKDPANPVLAAVRVPLDSWLCSVLTAQGGDYFLDMERGRQTSLFASALGLDEWEHRSERAAREERAADAEARRLEGELARARGALSAVRDDAAEAAAEWDRGRRGRLRELEEAHAAECRRAKGARAALDEAVAREESVRKGVAAWTADRALEDELADAERALRHLEDEAIRIGVGIQALEGRLEQLGDRNAPASCPACGQAVSSAHVREETERAERVLRGEHAALQNLRARTSAARNRRDVLDGRARAAEEAVRVSRANLADRERETALARRELLAVEHHLDRLEEDYEREEGAENPHAAAAERARGDRERLSAEVRTLSCALSAAESLRARCALWVRGFREIRLREVASALAELEAGANSALGGLGLPDWSLEFAVDRETKAGEVRRGFSVSVRSPASGGRAVPWAAWSGGEAQRLRVAANAGLGDLVRGRSGLDVPLEVWDEPTNGLSPEGKEDLFRFLAARAREESRVVFLLDHQAHDFGGFAGQATVIKTPSGSRVRASWAPSRRNAV